MHLSSDEYCMGSNLTGQPQPLIKSQRNGEVNYALTALAIINYSSGAFQIAEAFPDKASDVSSQLAFRESSLRQK